MSNQLTDQKFWTRYWESKPNLAIPVSNNYLFHTPLEEIVKRNKVKSAIELGGFPGYYSIFLKKYLNLEVTLLDFFVHQEILDKTLQKNCLQKNDIEVIEADLFTYKPQKTYDLVLSCGLIEHFEDTRDILKRHVNFLNPGGTLFITLPNFKSVNGWVQKRFDPENYSKHHIGCMDPGLLSDILTDLGLTVKKAAYFGGFSVWLENKQTKSLLSRAFVKALWFAGKVPTKIFRFESPALSPYIIIEATR